MARLSLGKLFEGVEDKKARNQRIHQASCAHECTLEEVGESLSLSCSTISVIVRRIDEEEKPRKRRSDPKCPGSKIVSLGEQQRVIPVGNSTLG